LKKKYLIVGLLAIALQLFSGCAAGNRLTIQFAKPLISGSIEALYEETDPAFAEIAMASHLKLLEGMLKSSPNDRRLLTTACQGFAGYAMLFVEPSDPERAREFYLRAREYGLRALGSKWTNGGPAGYQDFERSIGGLKKGNIPAAYWTAVAWGGWVNLSRSDPLASAQFPRVKKLMEWVQSQDSTYFHGGPLWFFGVYYSTLPPILGGNSALSNEYFKNAEVVTGGKFLWGKVLYAKTFAVQQLDRDLFNRLLTEAESEVRDEPPDLRLLNRIAGVEARKLLLQADELF